MTSDSKADINAAQAAGTTSAGQSAQYDVGARSAQVSDNDKDVGSDERVEFMNADSADAWRVNTKRTYDVHQSMDMQAALSNQQNLNYQTAQRDRHTELAFQDERARKNELHAQSMRHYEDQHTIRYVASSGFWADTVQEAFADRVADKVCVRMRK